MPEPRAWTPPAQPVPTPAEIAAADARFAEIIAAVDWDAAQREADADNARWLALGGDSAAFEALMAERTAIEEAHDARRRAFIAPLETELFRRADEWATDITENVIEDWLDYEDFDQLRAGCKDALFDEYEAKVIEWDAANPMPLPPHLERLNVQYGPFLTLAQLRYMPEPEWLVSGVIPQGSLGYITGRDGTYKTFLGLDVALHIVTGRDWHGRSLP